MSTRQTSRRNKNSATVSDASLSDAVIDVTNHARLRYLQRVDADCPNPNQQLRKMFRTGSAARAHPDVDEGKARRAGDVLVVYRGNEARPTIVTVLRDTTQRGQR
jgi:hypothetical protein